jgi:hypothetical protein
MLFLAGLQQIPGDMYEAASLDRASRWTTFWRITLPSIRRTLLLVIMLQTAAQLQLFGQAQLLTAGGPSGASRSIVLYIFEVAFGRWELGYASAMAEILFVMILAVTLLQYWLTTRQGAGSDEHGRAARALLPPVLIALLIGAAIMLTPDDLDLAALVQEQRRADGRQRGGLLRALHARELPLDLRRLAHHALAAQQPDRLAGTTAGVLVLCSLAGYGFARLDFPFRGTLFVFVCWASPCRSRR